MVLQDLGRRINAAVSDLTRSATLDEKVGACQAILIQNTDYQRPSMIRSRRYVPLCFPQT